MREIQQNRRIKVAVVGAAGFLGLSVVAVAFLVFAMNPCEKWPPGLFMTLMVDPETQGHVPLVLGNLSVSERMQCIAQVLPGGVRSLPSSVDWKNDPKKCRDTSPVKWVCRVFERSQGNR